VSQGEIFFNPSNEMVFECPLDGLMEKVRSEELVDICAREIVREGLQT
jgi:hypothetical protein